MNYEEEVSVDIKKINEASDNKDYSIEMIEAMFADSLYRSMQNAIVSQQNAQMASSASITNACARILQARSEPIKATEDTSAFTSTHKVSVEENDNNDKIEVIVDDTITVTTPAPSQVIKNLLSMKMKFIGLMAIITVLLSLILFAYIQPKLAVFDTWVEKELSHVNGKEIATDIVKGIEKELKKEL
jgi:hypothetical protein